MPYPKIASLRKPAAFLARLEELGLELPFDEVIEPAPASPLARPLQVDGLEVGNRFCVLPMEGWDGTPEGRPTQLTLRRWRRFGQSGAKLIWGGEAVAIRADGRANPNQLMIHRETLADLENLRKELVTAHEEAYGSRAGLVVGLQLTHSGRYARPQGKPAPRLAYDHPLLNERVGLPFPSRNVMSDDEVDEIIEDFIRAAVLAEEAGFDFVDIKHCHGYLLHEFLSAVDRPGRYGGSLENRTRPAREIIRGIRQRAPGLRVGVRLSAFDFLPFQPGPEGTGTPMPWQGVYPYAFGGDGTGLGIDLREPAAFLSMLQAWGVRLICITAGSPYTNPHIQRPAYFPPSDGYQLFEDPLVGVARQIQVTAALKASFPGLTMVGSAYSYLQEYIPHVAQAVVRRGMADLVGLGRSMLAYPQLPADVLSGRGVQRKYLCRTFSDCTTAPRHGLVSGCYPLDDFYKSRPENELLNQIKYPQG
ncbi:NADH:flavin oxidoreductases, Old Yellow Enzyme family [Anaerolinea thermolimosa]|nr:NADH:flavin oxidoreductases, Old Yellow Enzyme family [Anaerolinea thermolimosa]